MAAVAQKDRHQAAATPVQLALPPARIHDNPHWETGEPQISVILPYRREEPLELLQALAKLPEAFACEFIVYDDGARNAEMTAKLRQFADAAAAPVRIVTAGIPIGKARARNVLSGHCRAPWVLMLEANTMPADARFLRRYLDFVAKASRPQLAIGGFSPAAPPKSPRCALHHYHTTRSECVAAHDRSRRPVRHLHVGNALVHRDIFTACRFDELFRGRGWEGVDWGLRVARTYPIVHIDNPLIRTEFDNDFELLNRYRRSASNFARLVAWHPHALEKSPLMRAALLGRRLPFRDTATRLAGKLAVASSLPVKIRVRAFKVWRALVYAAAL